MEFLEDTDQPPFANVLLYGEAKTGKSTGAMSAPGRILYLNAETANATLFGRRKHNLEGRIRFPKWEGFKLLREVRDMAYAEPRVIDTVVLDTYGEAYRRLLAEMSNGAVRPSLNQRGDVAAHLEDFARFMVEAPVNFVIIAHELSEKDEDGGGFRTVAFTGSKSGSPGQSAKLMGLVDIVGYTGSMEVEGEGRK